MTSNQRYVYYAANMSDTVGAIYDGAADGLSQSWGIAVAHNGHIFITDNDYYYVLEINDITGAGAVIHNPAGSSVGALDVPYAIMAN